MRAATQGRGTDFINFSVVLESPDLAQAVANSVASHYVESSKKAQRSGNLSTIDFLQHERDRYHDLLQTTDNELDDYRAKHYADLPEQKDNIRSRLLQLRIEQDTRELQLKDSQSKLEEAAKQLAAGAPDASHGGHQRAEPCGRRPEEPAQPDAAQPSALLTTQTEDHPDVISLRQQIAAIKDQVEQEPERVDTSQKQVINPQYRDLLTDVSRLKQEVSGSEAALRQLAAAESANEAELADVVKQEKHYNDLLRNQAQYGQLYNQDLEPVGGGQAPRHRAGTGGHRQGRSLLPRAAAGHPLPPAPGQAGPRLPVRRRGRAA